MTAPTPGHALHDALRESAVVEFDLHIESFETWEYIRPSQRNRLEAAAQRAIAAYIELNGGDPVDIRSVVAEALAAPAAPQPAPGGLALAGIRGAAAGLIGMWDGMRKVVAPSGSEWEDWRAALGRIAEELVSQLDAIEDAAQQQPAPGFDRELLAEEKYLEAERTIDDYREEVTRLTADNDRLRGLLNEARIAEPRPAPRSDAETAELLRADLADAEAQLARWPRCPDGCGCRFGTDDADRNECGCDGLCNGVAPNPDAAMRETASRELAAAMAEARKVRRVLQRVLDWFDQGDRPTRWEAGATRAQVANAFRDGGLPVPSELVRFLGKRERT